MCVILIAISSGVHNSNDSENCRAAGFLTETFLIHAYEGLKHLALGQPFVNGVRCSRETKAVLTRMSCPNRTSIRENRLERLLVESLLASTVVRLHRRNARETSESNTCQK